MATVQTWAQGTRSTSLLSMGTLASATYLASAAIDLGAAIPQDVTIEVEATPGTVSGNKQLLVFAKTSLDNTNWSTGPETGSTATDEPNLHYIGALPLGTNATKQNRKFSLSVLPICRYIKLIVKNDSGAALASGEIYKADITGVST